MIQEPKIPSAKSEAPTLRKPQLSWPGLAVIAIAVWLLFFGGLEVLMRTGATLQTGTARISQTVGVAATLPTAAIATAPYTAVPIPTAVEVLVVPGIRGLAVANTALPTVPEAVTLSEGCVVITWRDGSQSCTDGTVIDAEHSRPGYCQIHDGICANGQPTGVIDRIDPEVAADPTVTPWPAKVDDTLVSTGVTWSGSYTSDGTSCVDVQFTDGHRQQNCGPKGVRYDAANLEFIARLIIDGRLGPGGFPKG